MSATSGRARTRGLLESVHIAGLAAWFGAAGMSGVFAAVTFPMMKRLDPKLPGYAGFEGEHWSLAAGQLANRVFVIADSAQFVGAMAAGVTFAVLVARRHVAADRLSTWVRGLSLSVGIACVAGLLIVVQPGMQSSFRAYWSAAEQGLTQEALRARGAADALHPWASRLIMGGTVCALTGLLAAGWGLGRSASIADDAGARA